MAQKPTVKRITINYPHEIWVKLRRLQEQGKIASIQEATERGVELLIEKLEEVEK